MPFTPHTPDDIEAMLRAIGAKNLDDLFDEIPKSLTQAKLTDIPEGLNELEVTQLMNARAKKISNKKCFIGAGAYEHFIPAAVWEIAGRGEFYSAYTPYQAEASQGTLQLIFEYQTIMAHLMGMDVANASLYDGATALAESILMAVRLQGDHAKRVLIPTNINPNWRRVLQTLVSCQGIIIDEFAFDENNGKISLNFLQRQNFDDVAAVIISQPNFFGVVEEVDEIVNFVHEQKSLVIAAVNPLAMAIFKEPGQWGSHGADIACGEGQPFGIPLSMGGPYFGFITCKKQFIRQLPGRIVGQTEDSAGRTGYTLTLQTREQHIRRAKATSNICTNQGLMVTAATIYLTLLGAQGLKSVAYACHAKSRKLCDLLISIPGVNLVFNTPFFHEFIIRFEVPVNYVLEKLNAAGIHGGFALEDIYPELNQCLLICVTETKTDEDLIEYFNIIQEALACYPSKNPSTDVVRDHN